jgi:hypothetical protein
MTAKSPEGFRIPDGQIKKIATDIARFPENANFIGPEVVAALVLDLADARAALLAAIPQPLVWTKEKPKVEGWYWVNMPRTIRMVQVVLDADDHLVIDWPGNWDWLVEYEWAGPIPQPKEEDKP